MCVFENLYAYTHMCKRDKKGGKKKKNTNTQAHTHGHTHGHTCAHTRTHTLTHSLTLTLTLSFILTWIFKSWRHNVPQYILHTLSMKEWLLTSVYIANHLDKHVFTFVFQYCLSEVFKWNIHTPATQSLKSVWATQYTKSVLRMIYSIKIMLRSYSIFKWLVSLRAVVLIFFSCEDMLLFPP